jgi:hypothetical protein
MMTNSYLTFNNILNKEDYLFASASFPYLLVMQNMEVLWYCDTSNIINADKIKITVCKKMFQRSSEYRQNKKYVMALGLGKLNLPPNI